MAKTNDNPDRVRLPQRGNDERRIGQKKSYQSLQLSSEIYSYLLDNKLRRCGPMNQIVDDLDSKLSQFDHQFWANSNQNPTTKLYRRSGF